MFDHCSVLREHACNSRRLPPGSTEPPGHRRRVRPTTWNVAKSSTGCCSTVRRQPGAWRRLPVRLERDAGPAGAAGRHDAQVRRAAAAADVLHAGQGVHAAAPGDALAAGHAVRPGAVHAEAPGRRVAAVLPGPRPGARGFERRVRRDSVTIPQDVCIRDDKLYFPKRAAHGCDGAAATRTRTLSPSRPS